MIVMLLVVPVLVVFVGLACTTLGRYFRRVRRILLNRLFVFGDIVWPIIFQVFLDVLEIDDFILQHLDHHVDLQARFTPTRLVLVDDVRAVNFAGCFQEALGSVATSRRRGAVIWSSLLIDERLFEMAQ